MEPHLTLYFPTSNTNSTPCPPCNCDKNELHSNQTQLEEFQAVAAKMRNLETMLDVKKKEYASLYSEYQQSETSRKQLHGELVARSEEIKALNEKFDNYRLYQENTQASERKKAEEVQKNVLSTLSICRSKIGEVQSALLTMKQDLDHKTSLLEQATARVRHLENHIAVTEKHIRRNSEHDRSFDEALQKLVSEKAQLVRNRDILQSELDAKTQNLILLDTERTNQIGILEATLREKTDSEKKLKEELNYLQHDFQRKQAELRNMSNESATKQQQLKDVIDKLRISALQSVENSRIQQEARIKFLEAEVVSLNAMLGTCNDKKTMVQNHYTHEHVDHLLNTPSRVIPRHSRKRQSLEENVHSNETDLGLWCNTILGGRSDRNEMKTFILREGWMSPKLREAEEQYIAHAQSTPGRKQRTHAVEQMRFRHIAPSA